MPAIPLRFAQETRVCTATRARSRNHCAKHLPNAGMPDADGPGMSKPSTIEPWTIPFHVIMWATLLCGLIMTIVVVLKN